MRPIDNYPELRDDLSHLNTWQRLRRKLALLGGAYTHPNGFIELDFEAAAGVNFSDTEEVAEAKMKLHEARHSRRSLVLTCVFWSVSAMLLLHECVLHRTPG